MNRTEKFARVFALAHALYFQLTNDEHRSMDNYRADMQRKPADTLTRMHRDLAAHLAGLEANGTAELLYDMMGEQIANISLIEFTNEPLDKEFFLYQSRQAQEARQVMSAQKAGRLWGLSPAYVRNLCADGTVKATKVGKTWAIPIDHPNPKQKIKKRARR